MKTYPSERQTVKGKKYAEVEPPSLQKTRQLGLYRINRECYFNMASNKFENIVVVNNDYSQTILVAMGNQFYWLPLFHVYLWRKLKGAVENSRGDDHVMLVILQSLLIERYDNLYGRGRW